ncbi:hypothetical protein OIU84_022573 [Salix udensis]|uniref:Uncharacterized protein n=1 Tax=Salix udensis TaxID=889485 RepID=A0AAD6KP78_9ROSI|nr:hypothetical protein OIU84_022573 [Salix udensis]
MCKPTSLNLSCTEKLALIGVEKSASTRETTAPPCKALASINDLTSHRGREAHKAGYPEPEHTETIAPPHHDLAWDQQPQLSHRGRGPSSHRGEDLVSTNYLH